MNCVPFHSVERSCDVMRGTSCAWSSSLAKRRIRWIDVSVTLTGHIKPELGLREEVLEGVLRHRGQRLRSSRARRRGAPSRAGRARRTRAPPSRDRTGGTRSSRDRGRSGRAREGPADCDRRSSASSSRRPPARRPSPRSDGSRWRKSGFAQVERKQLPERGIERVEVGAARVGRHVAGAAVARRG